MPAFLFPITTAIAVILFFCLFITVCYKKAPPTEAIVITGLGHKEPKVVCGKGAFVIPFVQRADTLDMRIMKMDVKTPETGVKTNEGVPLWIDSVVTAQVYSNNSSISDDEIKELGVESKSEYIGCRCGTSHGTPSGSNHGRRRLGGQIIQQEDIVKNTFNSFLEGASVTCFVGYLFAIMVFIVSACISWALNINIASFLAGTGLVIVGTILGYGICLLMYANYNKYYKKK